MPTVNLRRAQDYVGGLRRMKVELDGQVVARLKPGTSQTIEVDTGAHTLRAGMDWACSRPLQLSLSDSDVVTVETSFGWRGLIYMTFNPRRALDLRLADGEASADDSSRAG